VVVFDGDPKITLREILLVEHLSRDRPREKLGPHRQLPHPSTSTFLRADAERGREGYLPDAQRVIEADDHQGLSTGT